MTSRPRRYLLLAGAVTGVLGLGISYAASGVMHIRATPVQAMAEVVIERTPGGIAETLIQAVGRHDKPLLVAGIIVVILLLSAVAGLLSRRSRLIGFALFLVMALIGGWAVSSRPEFAAADLVPVVLGGLTWWAAYGVLTSAAEKVVPPAPGKASPSRRSFLITSTGVAAAAVLIGSAGRLLGGSRRAVEATRRLLRLPVSEGVVPQGAEFDVKGLAPWRTPNRAFYRIDTAVVLPAIDPDDWSVRIHGMVDREITLSYADLMKRRLTEAWVTLCCVSNPVGGDLIGNAWWSGVRIADVLADAGVSPDADAVLQTSQDGWTCGTPIEALTDDRNALLAIAMNGEPLPIEHGFPVRMVVPGLYGYVSATKWVIDLEVTRFDRFQAFWTENGWSERGPVKTESRIDAPRDGADVPAGAVRVGGQAWAQHTGIAKVEFRIDGGAWAEAELGRVPGRDTWVQWAGTARLEPGDHTVAVRATDRSGYTQTSARADVVPDGATGWPSVDFTAH